MMRDDLDLKSVRCFLMLSEELNFSRAAARMSITQPSFSSQIRKLEDQIGQPLFLRSTRQVAITAAGQALLEPARSLLEQSRKFAQAASRLSVERLARVVLGAPIYVYGISEHDELLELLRTHLPNVRLTVDNGFNQSLISGLSNGDVDIAMVIATPVMPSEWHSKSIAHTVGELEVPADLPRLALRRETVKLAIPAEHRLAHYAIVPPLALHGEPIAMLSDAHGETICKPICDVLERGGAQIVVPPEAHGIALERYCRQRRVPAISVGWFREGIDDDIVYRPIEGLEVASELVLIRGHGEWNSDGARKIWDAAREHFKAGR
jgi:DNA-binding transcriptional LysR family regulator